jgi:methylenetetrahydrofolate reductase (NADPH)
MGRLSFEAMETIEVTGVPVKPEQLVIHLNTFHRKMDLDRILREMADTGVRYILVVNGDGNERLHRLEAEELGMTGRNVTSVELIEYINREYPGVFTLGVAFNQYEPQENEREKLQRKLNNGAEFIITQPVIRQDNNIDWVQSLGVPVIVEAWMSKRIDLVAECVGYELPPEEREYDPVDNYNALKANYPACGVYFAFLGLHKQVLKLGLTGTGTI